MESFKLISSLVALIVALILIFGLSLQKENRLANRILASAFAFSTLNLFFATTYLGNFRFIQYLDFTLGLMASAGIFLYFFKISTPDVEIKKVALISAGPPLLGLVCSLGISKLGSLSHSSFLAEQAAYLREIFRAVILGIFLILSYRELTKIEERLSNITACPKEKSLQWMRFLILTVFFLWGAKMVLIALGSVKMLYEWRPLFMLLALSGLVIAALKESKVFEGISTSSVRSEGFLNDSQLRLYSEKLQELFKRKRPYLNSDLRLSELAMQLNLKPYQLTEVIGRGLGTNFFSLVNQYRVEEVKRRLRDPESQKVTILAVALDSGFNSKSAFAQVFKQYVGVTPKAYREQTFSRT